MAALPPMPASWPLYFGEDYVADDRRALLTAELAAFLASAPGWPLLRVGAGVAPGRRFVALALDYAALAAGSGSPDLVASLEVQPTEGLACIAAAAHEVSKWAERMRCAAFFFIFFFRERQPTLDARPPLRLSLPNRSSSAPAPPTARPPSACHHPRQRPLWPTWPPPASGSA